MRGELGGFNRVAGLIESGEAPSFADVNQVIMQGAPRRGPLTGLRFQGANVLMDAVHQVDGNIEELDKDAVWQHHIVESSERKI
ncbi:MAG: hypothetical protein FWE31_02210 [Firmicutes bacterium]|nr:hypothetical protein [Bacillota bacterium]